MDVIKYRIHVFYDANISLLDIEASLTILYNGCNELCVLNHLEGMWMRILSWNINGLPSCLKSGAFEPLLAHQADAICLQRAKGYGQYAF